MHRRPERVSWDILSKSVDPVIGSQTVIFNRFTNKLGLVQSVFNKPQRLAVERQINKALEECRSNFTISRAGAEILLFDVLYALARHARWVKVPLFRDVLVDFLVTDHELPRVGSEKLVNDILESCESLMGDDPNFSAADLLDGKVDEEYLTYIFVVAACSAPDAVIRENLGLGAGLLRSLKSAAESLASREAGVGGDGPKLFLPDVDTVFANIMIKLTAAVRSCPWALDVYRMKYHLLEKLDRQRYSELAGHIPAVFEFLCSVGRENHAALPQDLIERKWLAVFEGQEMTQEIERTIMPDRLFVLLEHAGLIFRADVKKRGKRQVVFWDLTPMAEQLTADAYLTTRAAPASMEPTRLTTQSWFENPSKWRRGYLRQAIMKSDPSEIAAATAALDKRVEDPLIVESVISTLAKSGAFDVAEEFFMLWSSGSLTQADAVALSKTGGILRGRSAVRARLQNIAESNDSVALRSAALEGLL